MGKMKDLTIPDWDQYSHDPMCVEPQTDYPCKQCWEIECECLCICDIIAKVREDQTQRCIDALEGDALHDPDPLWSGTHWNNAVFECSETLRALLGNDSVPDSTRGGASP